MQGIDNGTCVPQIKRYLLATNVATEHHHTFIFELQMTRSQPIQLVDSLGKKGKEEEQLSIMFQACFLNNVPKNLGNGWAMGGCYDAQRQSMNGE